MVASYPILSRAATHLPEIYENLWVGSCHAAKDLEWLTSTGITHILNVTAKGQVRNYYEDKFEYCRCDCEDLIDAKIDEHFNKAFEFLRSVVKAGGKVLVHCRAGRSRSCTLCIGFGMHQAMTLRAAHEAVSRCRTNMQLNIGFQIKLMHLELQILKVKENSFTFFPGKACCRHAAHALIYTKPGRRCKRLKKWDFSARASVRYDED